MIHVLRIRFIDLSFGVRNPRDRTSSSGHSQLGNHGNPNAPTSGLEYLPIPGLVSKYSIHSEQNDRIQVLSVPNSTQLFFQRWKSKVIFQEAHFPLNNHDARKSLKCHL